MKPTLFLLLSLFGIFGTQAGCQPPSSSSGVQSLPATITSTTETRIDTAGKTLLARFPTPSGLTRVPADSLSFGSYLRNFPLLPHGSQVHYFDGSTKFREVHEAVLDIDVGKRDLQQCADAVMRLRAEYLYSRERDEDIHFNFTNGFTCDFASWKAGKRVAIEGNKTWWVQRGQPGREYATFRKYLTMVFSYAGTASLEKELKRVSLEDVQPGDVFIQGGFPGHAIIVMDVLIHATTGAKHLLLAQSYMPAQEIHILKNPENPTLSPWYDITEVESYLYTPEWTFERTDLKRFE